MDCRATVTANKTDPGYQDHPRQLQPVSGIVGEVQQWLPEAAQLQLLGNRTAAIGLLLQGPPYNTQKQGHVQQHHRTQDAKQDEGGHRHDTERPGQRQQLPMHETVKS